MSIKHIGYGLVDKENEIVFDDNGDFVFEERKVEIKSRLEHENFHYPRFGPHKIVRILIDDEVGE